jgi:hypothetical protein
MTCISSAVKIPSFNKFGVGKGYPLYLKIFTFSGFPESSIDATLFKKRSNTLPQPEASKAGTVFGLGWLG